MACEVDSDGDGLSDALNTFIGDDDVDVDVDDDGATTRSPFRIFLMASVELSPEKTPDDDDVDVMAADVASLNVSSSGFFRCASVFIGVTGALTLFRFSDLSFSRFVSSRCLSLSRCLSFSFLL